MHSPAPAAELASASALLGVALVLVAGAALGALARRWRQPTVVGEMAAGILLGPSFLGLFPGAVPETLFPAPTRSILAAIAQVGLALFMFLIGWDFRFHRSGNRRSIAVGLSVSSVVVSFTLGALLASLLYRNHHLVNGHVVPPLVFDLFVGAVLSVTAFPVLARILREHELENSRIGSLVLAGAAIDDVLAWLLLAAVSAVASARDAQLVEVLVLTGAYLVVLLGIARPLVGRLLRAPRVSSSAPSLFVFVAAGVFISSCATSVIGLHAIFGAFFFGLIMPRDLPEPLRRQLQEKLFAVATLLVPVFFVVTGLNVDVGGMSLRDFAEAGAVIVVACVGKLVGSGAPVRLSGASWRETGMVAVLMNTRGLTGLVMVEVGMSLGVLDGSVFTMLVLAALVTTAMTGPLLRLLGQPVPIR